MKPYIFYNIWNKPDGVPLIFHGVRKCIPKNSIIDITLENPINDSLDLFKSQLPILQEFDVRWNVSNIDRLIRNRNIAIRRFMESDCDVFINLQDDMYIQDSFLIPDLTKLYNENPNAGLITLRDALTITWQPTHGSNFSDSTVVNRLRSGEYVSSPIVNDGTLILNKNTVNKVGLFDEDFIAFYVEYDYSLRCNNAGLINFAMGAEIVHLKVGRVIASDHYENDSNWGNKDLELLRKKYPQYY